LGEDLVSEYKGRRDVEMLGLVGALSCSPCL